MRVQQLIRLFGFQRRLEHHLISGVGIAVQHLQQLGDDVPRAVNVQQLAMRKEIQHLSQTVDPRGGRLVAGVDGVIAFHLLGVHLADSLIHAKHALFIAVMEGIQHAVGGCVHIGFHHVRAHLERGGICADGVLGNIAAPAAAMHGDQAFFLRQLLAQRRIDLRVARLSKGHIDHSFMLSLPPRP